MTPEERVMRDRVLDQSKRRDLFITAWLQNPGNSKADIWRLALEAFKLADAAMVIDAYQTAHEGKLPKLHTMHGYTGVTCYDCSHPEDEWCSDIRDPEPEPEIDRPPMSGLTP